MKPDIMNATLKAIENVTKKQQKTAEELFRLLSMPRELRPYGHKYVKPMMGGYKNEQL